MNRICRTRRNLQTLDSRLIDTTARVPHDARSFSHSDFMPHWYRLLAYLRVALAASVHIGFAHAQTFPRHRLRIVAANIRAD